MFKTSSRFNYFKFFKSANLRPNISILPFYSGLLTGKYVRDAKPSSTDTRVGFLQQKSMPLWDMYKDNDKYWALIDAMKKIAKNKGTSFRVMCKCPQNSRSPVKVYKSDPKKVRYQNC